MPSQTTSWITEHGPLAILHVTSTDPRRAGAQDIAMFESELSGVLSVYKWRIRHGQIENEYGKSVLNVICQVRKMGSMQMEPNCDFTVDNLCKRSAPLVSGLANITKFKLENKNWKSILWHKRNGCDMFPKLKYRSRLDWVELDVELYDGGTIKIKVNKWLVDKIPKKLVFRPGRPYNQLFLLPNSAQFKRRKGENDRRHGMALTSYILEVAGSVHVGASRLRDRFDYRLDAQGDFIQSCNPKNEWFDTEDGCVLKIIYPEGFCSRAWDNLNENVYPKAQVLPRYVARVGYFLMAETIADVAKDYSWVMNGYDATSSNFEYQNLKGGKFRLSRLVCELSGISTLNIIEPARVSKYYEASLQKTDDRSLRRRAKFENSLSSEQATSNNMYVQSKFVSHRRIHTEKYKVIHELSITALDLRIESIRVGGKFEHANHTTE